MHHIHHYLEIEAPAIEVFHAVTVPGQIDSWWTKKCQGIPEIGELYEFYFAPEFDWRAIVKELKMNEVVIYLFTQADDDWSETSLHFNLTSLDNNRTGLHFLHKNWKEDNLHFSRSSFCWAMYLKCLKDYVEEGTVLPYEERGGS